MNLRQISKKQSKTRIAEDRLRPLKQKFRNVINHTFTGLRLAYIHPQQQDDKTKNWFPDTPAKPPDNQQ